MPASKKTKAPSQGSEPAAKQRQGDPQTPDRPVDSYVECFGLARLILHETVLKLRESGGDRVSVADVQAACEEEAGTREEPALQVKTFNKHLRQLTAKRWLKTTQKGVFLTKDGWNAYGWSRNGEEGCYRTRQMGEGSVSLRCFPLSAWRTMPVILDILVRVKESRKEARSDYTYDPRVGPHGEVTDRELANWAAWAGQWGEGYTVALQHLMLKHYIFVVNAGPLQQTNLICASDLGRAALHEYHRLEQADEASGNYIFESESDSEVAAEDLASALYEYLRSATFDLSKRISLIPDREARQLARVRADELRWPERGVRFDQIVRDLLIAVPSRIQGTHSSDLDSLLFHARHACHDGLSIADKEYAFCGTRLELNVPMMVNILAGGVQNRRLHVSQVHAFPGERAGAEGMVLQAGRDQRQPGERLTATKPRFVIRRQQREVVLDGKKYRLSPERFALLLPLAESPQRYLSGEQLSKTSGAGCRPSSIRNDLPGPIRAIVLAARGKGLMMDLEPNLIRIE